MTTYHIKYSLENIVGLFLTNMVKGTIFNEKYDLCNIKNNANAERHSSHAISVKRL